MDFLWPGFLYLWALIPAIIGIYIWMLRRRRKYTVRYSSLSLVRDALPKTSQLRRHLPMALFLLGLAVLVFALARPVTILSIPTDQTTIILTMDVSMSMRSGDIAPSRIEAAEDAALSFIKKQKRGTQIGIVAFSAFAETIQPPTTDQGQLEAAVESLMLGRRTAIGSGILEAIDAIAESDPNIPASRPESSKQADITPVPRGAYVPAIIVLLTDGVSNAGPLPLDAAQQAVDRGIRVYTIGYGTANGFLSPQDMNPQQGGGGFGGPQSGGGGGFGGRGGFRTAIDEATLKEVAKMTGGEYYAASSSSELQSVFNNLPTYLITKHEISEASAVFTAIGALLAGIAIALSILWHPLP